MIMLKFIFILCFVSCAFAQKAGFGACPDVQPMQNFNVSSFLGTWYLQLEYYSLLGIGINCETHEFKLNEDGTLTDDFSAQGFLINPTWSITLTPDPENPAKLSGRLPLSIFSTPFEILDTDYDSYAAIWSCSDIIKLADSQFGWVLTRDRNATDEVIDTGKNVFQNNNLDVDYFKRDSQSDCSN